MRPNLYRKTDRPKAVNRKRHADNAARQPVHVTKGDTVRVVRGDDKGKGGDRPRGGFFRHQAALEPQVIGMHAQRIAHAGAEAAGLDQHRHQGIGDRGDHDAHRRREPLGDRDQARVARRRTEPQEQ